MPGRGDRHHTTAASAHGAAIRRQASCSTSGGATSEIRMYPALIVVWVVLQFAPALATGWTHLLLIAGVILVIRGVGGRET